MEFDTTGKVLKKAVLWKQLYFYRKSDVLFQLTVEFCKRYLPQHGDRTVDQMVQSARSGKQNIVEGSEDGQTSSEMEIKLLNVARGSLHELRADYQDYLNTHHLTAWEQDNERQQRLKTFCHGHNDYKDYAPLLPMMNDEEMANLALTLCHQTDKDDVFLSAQVGGEVCQGGRHQGAHVRSAHRLPQETRRIYALPGDGEQTNESRTKSHERTTGTTGERTKRKALGSSRKL